MRVGGLGRMVVDEEYWVEEPYLWEVDNGVMDMNNRKIRGV